MRVLLFILAFIKTLDVSANFHIQGQIQTDSTWEPIIYLSLIPSFEEMFTVSNEMIVAWAKIDSEGYFLVSGDHLPQEDHLYRLHISKKGDPPATIMIGGKDQNFQFLILDNQSQCALSQDTVLAENRTLQWRTDCYPNDLLDQVNHIVAYEDQFSSEFSFGKELMNYALYEKLREFADTSSNSLAALYALYHTPFETHAREYPGYYLAFIQKWEKTSSNAYLETFKNSLPKPPGTSTLWYIVVITAFVGIVLGWMGHWTYLKYLSQKVNPSSPSNGELYQLLSIQERKIFELIQEGTSNKEIAHQLHIEVSTVKSHIRNIYGKLGINSRREAMNFK